VIVRGNQRQKTFFGDSDYHAYLEQLGRYRKRFGVTVYAHCLMLNHVHLSVETDSHFDSIIVSSHAAYRNKFCCNTVQSVIPLKARLSWTTGGHGF
jgi:REP element-mobilizing transposase RayT